ncbi:tetratricopeptide repeat protein [Chloroflexi bacterium TSY]|nr:tetratricopeptide repeat protein [Chloroflexi bacterium TSY]
MGPPAYTFARFAFAGQEVFWLTIHPQLTDRLNDILFRLAYFLHLQGASALWLQLMADQGVMQEYTITLLQHELAQIGQTPLILCFDEVDLLRPNDLVAHAQIVSLLESLRGLVPMLLIGQRHLVEVDHQCMLTGLSSPAIAQLAHQAELRLSRAALEQIQALTQGNPRLIELSLVYYQSTKRIGVAEQELLSGLTKELSLEFLLRRIWRHLTEAEMLLLETLAIFRNPAPIWVWQTEESQAALKQLSKWRLIQEDIQGGLTLLPVLKEAIQRLITIEELEKLHRRAAQIRTQCGQYTSAAWHYVQAGDPKAALKLWDTHRQQELDQGQAAAALSLLQSVSAQHLTQKTRELLYLRRAELQKLLGYYNEVLAELQTAHWRVPFLEAQAHRMQGDIAALRGETVQALDAYASSQATLEQLLSESASLHRAQGYSQVHDRNFGVAQREVFRIRHDAANLEGIIFDKQGNKREALASLEAAVRLAQEADYPYGEANARNHLGVLYGWQRQVDRADRHLRVAIDYFRGTGRLNKLASATVNLAFVHLLCDNYQEAVAQAEEALELFTKLGEEFGRAVSTELLAEAHLALGNLEQAETYAWQTLHAEDVNTQPDALRTLGEIRLQQGNKEEAAKLIQQSLDIAQSTENKVLEAYAWRALGLVQIAQKEQEAALDSLRRAITLFQACDMPVEVKKTKREIS